MTKLLIFLVVLVSFSSCMTMGRIKRNCDKFTEICYDPISSVVTVRDTIVYIKPIEAKLPYSNINITLELRVIDGRVNMDKQVFTSGLINTEVWVVDNKLHVHSFLNDSSILVKPDPVIIPGAITNTETKEVLKVKYIPKVYKWALYICILELIFIVLSVYLKIKGKTLFGLFSILKKKT